MKIINFLDERWLIDLLNNLFEDTKSILNYLDLLDKIKQICGRESICYHSVLLEKHCIHGPLCEVIWGDLSRNEEYRDILQRISRTISEADNISVNQENNLSFESGAQTSLHANKNGGLIYNKEETSNWWNANSMIVIKSIDDIKNLYRTLSVYHAISYHDFSNYLDKAFPDLFFFADAKDFSKACIAEKHDNGLSILIFHLSYLNDYARKDFLEAPAQFEQKARSYGIELSRESSGTKDNKAATRERTKEISGLEIFFELHTKLTREKGRIHFHIGSNLDETILNTTGGRVIIGIICKHLST
ncbi:hypothetical protein [Pectobacterium versatile]|uniref:hypothetical protein n=1 Tax=Pectobacterium versatile TaxID=2488639 RepID=UPI001F24036C|nr:hypothetical protein [Pectobacterium versatile]